MNSNDVFSKSSDSGNKLIKVLIIVIAVALLIATGILVFLLQRQNNTTGTPVTSYPVYNLPGTSYPVSMPLPADTPLLETSKVFRLAGTDLYGIFDNNMKIEETSSRVTITGDGFTLSFEVANQAAPKAVEKMPLVINSPAFGNVVQLKESDSVYKYSNDMNLNLGLNCSTSGNTIDAPCGVPQVKLNNKYINVTCSGSGSSFLLNCNTLMNTISFKPVNK